MASDVFRTRVAYSEPSSEGRGPQFSYALTTKPQRPGVYIVDIATMKNGLSPLAYRDGLHRVVKAESEQAATEQVLAILDKHHVGLVPEVTPGATTKDDFPPGETSDS